MKALGDRYAEAPVAVGLIDSKTIVEVFARIDGDSFTLVTSRADGNSCILLAGKVWIKVPYKLTGPRT